MRGRKQKALGMMIMVLFCIMYLSLNANAATNYNSSAALNYAKAHWNDGKGKCAEFVSDCIKAGGCGAWSASASVLLNSLKASGMGQLYEINFSAGQTIYMPNYNGKISAGDPVFYYCSGCTDGRPYVHTVLCNGSDSSGYMRAYSHNNANPGTSRYSYSSKCYACGGTISKAYVYHFNTKLSPRVMVDSLQANGDGTIHLRGWAFDQDNSSATVTIHTYIGGDVGDAGAEGWAFTAELDSPDVNQAYGITGKHRFDVTIKTGKRGNQTVVVYALDTNQGENACYGVMSVNITNSNAIVAQEVVTVDEGSSVNLNFTFHGDGIIQLAGENRDGSIISSSWNQVDWNNTKASINIKGLKAGKTYLDLYFLDGNKNKFYKKSIEVTVLHVHKYTIEKVTKEPTCTETGLKKYYCSCGAVSSQTTTLGKKTHVYVTDPAVAATCTQSGKTEGKHCSLCGYVYKKQDVIPAKGHSYVVNKEIPATCTNSGWTEEKYCSVCWTVFSEQEKIPAKGHNYVVDKAVAATCTTSGKTEGKHCSTCGYIAVVQKEIPIREHEYKNGECIWCGKKSDNTSSSDQDDKNNSSDHVNDSNKPGKEPSNNTDKNTNSTNSSVKDNNDKNQDNSDYQESDNYNDPNHEDQDNVNLDNKDDTTTSQEDDCFKSNNLYYRITSHKKKQVTVLKCLNKNCKSINIPAKVSYKGKNYSVVSIHAKAFSSLKKVKKITIGKNVKTIEKMAFYNCKKLKTVQINATNLKRIDKKAFGKVNGKCLIRVKAKKLSKYKKLLSKGGLNKIIKIKTF